MDFTANSLFGHWLSAWLVPSLETVDAGKRSAVASLPFCLVSPALCRHLDRSSRYRQRDIRRWLSIIGAMILLLLYRLISGEGCSDGDVGRATCAWLEGSILIAGSMFMLREWQIVVPCPRHKNRICCGHSLFDLGSTILDPICD
jgi:hypothetical protein